MGRIEKTLDPVLRGTADASIPFADLCTLLRYLGFDERVRGSHHIFTRSDVVEIINLQPRGNQAKPYQVQQVRGVIVAYRLAGEAVEPVPEPAENDTPDGTNSEA